MDNGWIFVTVFFTFLIGWILIMGYLFLIKKYEEDTYDEYTV